jgi:hypothetical protein
MVVEEIVNGTIGILYRYMLALVMTIKKIKSTHEILKNPLT